MGKKTSFERKHYVNVSKEGKFNGEGIYASDSSDIDLIEVGEEESITLYFHGGLVSEKGFYKTEVDMFEKLKSANTYPYFIVWESGLGSSIRNLFDDTGCIEKILNEVFDLFENRVKSDKKEEKILIKGGFDIQNPTDLGVKSLDVLNLSTLRSEGYKGMVFDDDTFEEMTLRSLLESSDIDTEPLNQYVEQDTTFDLKDFKMDVDATLSRNMPGKLDDIQAMKSKGFMPTGGDVVVEAGKFLVKVTTKVLIGAYKAAQERLKEGTDHGKYATFVEEFMRRILGINGLRIIWNEMKEIIDKSLRNESDRSINLLLKKLNDLKGANPSLKINLVGHSAGGIYINELIHASVKNGYDDLSFENVIYLAPACTHQQYFEKAMPHKERVENQYLFTMSDTYEKEDNVIIVYPNSLLYFISGLLEDKVNQPIMGMHHFLINESERYTEEEKKAIEQVSSDVVTKVFSKCDLSNATEHGGFFPEDKALSESIVKIISEGSL